MICNKLYEKPLVESYGISEPVESKEDKLAREAQDWLLGRVKKKKKKPGEIDEDAIRKDVEDWEREFSLELRNRHTAADVLLVSGWGDDD